MAAKKPAKTKISPEHIKFVWGLLCSLSSIDQQLNNISLFNVIDQLTIPKEEFTKAKGVGDGSLLVPIANELVLVWRRVIDSSLCDNLVVTDIKISLLDPAGIVLHEILTPLEFQPKKRTMRMRIQNQAFKVTRTGDYVYRIEIKQPGQDTFSQVGEVPLQVAEMAQ